jgi:hypothetical protein
MTPHPLHPDFTPHPVLDANSQVYWAFLTGVPMYAEVQEAIVACATHTIFPLPSLSPPSEQDVEFDSTAHARLTTICYAAECSHILHAYNNALHTAHYAAADGYLDTFITKLARTQGGYMPDVGVPVNELIAQFGHDWLTYAPF